MCIPICDRNRAMEGSIGMLNSPPASATYTLPGVMHYLQTEFTRNERDRIGWELERSEMKTRIAQLEGENRTLRYQLAGLRGATEGSGCGDFSEDDAAIQEPLLLKSKLAVQENVKEIVYLLRSPNVTDQLQELGEFKDVVHNLGAMNLNSSPQHQQHQHQHQQHQQHQHHQPQHQLSHKAQVKQPTSRTVQQAQLTQNENQNHQYRQATVTSFTPESGPQAKQPLDSQGDLTGGALHENSSGQESDVDTIVPDESIQGRSRASSLFSSKSGNVVPEHVLRCKRLRYHLAGVEKLVMSQYNLLSYARDGLLKHWMIEPNLNCNEKLTKSFHGLAPMVLGLYWLDSSSFITVDNFGLKVWSTGESAPLMALDIFSDDADTSFSEIISIDYKNNWLVLTYPDIIKICEVIVSQKCIEVGKTFALESSGRIQDSILGMTEKSLIVFKQHPYELVIYSFQGDVLQTINLQDAISEVAAPEELSDKDVVKKLLLNKQTSKLLIQLGTFIAVYSFDHKKLVLTKRLAMPPSSIIFRSRKDYVIFAYDDGQVEVRNINRFQSVLKTYNHYDEETEFEDDDNAPNPDAGDKILNEARQNPHRGTIIDVAEIDSAAVVISGGDDGIIRLERVTNYA